MTPRITIITICYNAASCIERTLRSVAMQTYPHIEYLIIDGASKDATLQLVAELAPQAKVYSEPDKGIYDAMNKGRARSSQLRQLAPRHHLWRHAPHRQRGQRSRAAPPPSAAGAELA